MTLTLEQFHNLTEFQAPLGEIIGIEKSTLLGIASSFSKEKRKKKH